MTRLLLILALLICALLPVAAAPNSASAAPAAANAYQNPDQPPCGEGCTMMCDYCSCTVYVHWLMCVGGVVYYDCVTHPLTGCKYVPVYN